MNDTKKNTHTIASYSAINMIGQGLRVGLSFLAILLVSRWLGAKGFGEINLILGYTSYLAYFLTFGFDNSLPFYSSSMSKHQTDTTFESVLIAGVLNTVIGGAVVLAVANYFLPSLLKINGLEHFLLPAKILCFQTFIIALGSVLAGYLRGVKIFWPVIAKDQFLFGIIHFLGVIVFIKIMKWDVLGYAISYTLATCIGFIVVFIVVIKKIKTGISIQLSFQNWKSWSSFSFPLGIMNTVEPLINWSSILIVGYFLTATEVGQLSISLRLAFFIQFIFVSLQPIFSPYIADLIKDGNKLESEVLLGTVCYWSAKWALLFSFLLIHGAPFILSVFGDSYSSANICLYILVPGFVFEGLFGPIKQTLIMAGHSRVNLLNLLISLFLNIVLSFLFIPKFGLAGSALSFTLTYIFLNMVRIWQVYFYFKIMPFNRRQIRNLTLLLIGLAVLSMARVIVLKNELWFGLSLFCFLVGIIAVYWKDREIFFYWLKKKTA